MSQQVYTKIVERLAKGCMGLHYSYFDQGSTDSATMQRDIAILGDFQGKDRDPFSGGICFGLAVMYLAGCSPKGRGTWGSSDALMGEFAKAVKADPASEGMLHAIAQAYVRQKEAAVMWRSDMTNPKVLVCRGCSRQYAEGTKLRACSRCGSTRLETDFLRDVDVAAQARLRNKKPEELRDQRYENAHRTMQGAYSQALTRFRANEAGGTPELEGHSSPHKHAIRDQLMANFTFKPSPAHDSAGVRRNYKSFPLDLDQDEGDFTDYKPRFRHARVKALVDFCGEKNTFSLVSYERLFKGGHQMAIWSDGSRSRFFDPNFGVISFSFQSGLVTFLSRYLPFLYCWSGVRDPGTGKYTRKSETFMNTSKFSSSNWDCTSLDFDVYRYSP